MKILVLNGPNLNMLGKRDPKYYGMKTLQEINNDLLEIAKTEQVSLEFFQSNHEGALIDFLQKNAGTADGILINPGALTNYGFSLRDGLIDAKLPIVVVHLSDISKREDFRKQDVIADIAQETVMGQKDASYTVGLKKLLAFCKRQP